MLDFIRDIFASFRQSSLERVKSPFLGVFVFSWIGFNWPILAILFFSKHEIEKKISYVFENYGIQDYLIAPLCTSALIAYLLPKVNKFVTKIQDKPNTDTIEMSLESKIKIAKKQQEIAEIEARKKLAEKKEEKYIEESIEQIKKEHEEALVELKVMKKNNKEISNDLTDIAKSFAESQSHLTVEKEARIKVEQELLSVKESIRSISEKLISSQNETNKVKAEISGWEKENKALKNKISNIDSYNKHLLDEINFVSDKAPEFFRTFNNTGRVEVQFNSSNYHNALNALNKSDGDGLLTAYKKPMISFSSLDFSGRPMKEKVGDALKNELNNIPPGNE